MAVNYISFDAGCPRCGGVHGVKYQTEMVGSSAPGTHFHRVGSQLDEPVDPVRRELIRVRAPSAGEPLRLLDDGVACGEHRLWTEITVDGRTITALRLVELDLSELAHVHYLPPRSGELWGWASDLLNPRTWCADLATKDPLRRLRLALMLREPLAARHRHEGALFVAMIESTPTGPLESVEHEGRAWWQQPCVAPAPDARSFVLTFDLADATVAAKSDVVALPGVSRIITADFFHRRAGELAAKVPVYTADLLPEEAPGHLDAARRDLRQAVVYLDQLLALIPADDEEVPLEAFWGDRPRAAREARPDRYAQTRLEATRERWLDDVERMGTRRPLTARSAEEADLYMSLHPCPSCGVATPRLTSRIESRGRGLVSIYQGVCPSCELPRRFDFTLADDLPPASTDDAVVYGDGRSSLLDPGQFVLVAERLARTVPARLEGLDAAARGRATYALQMAIGALDEAMKFIPTAEDSVPESAITSRAGWAVYDLEPGRFTRVRLQAVRDAYRALLPRR